MLVEHGPAVGERGGDRCGHIGGFAQAERIGRTDVGVALVGDEVVVAFDTEQRHGAVVEERVGTARIEVLEGRLRVDLEGDQAVEHVVGESDHRASGTEVRRQPHVVGADLFGGTQVLGDVGSTEPIDRLLGIADDE